MRIHGMLTGSAVALALTLTACGGDSTTTGGTTGGTTAAQTISVTVPGADLKFDKAQIDATANQPFKVKFVNNGTVQHNFVIKQPSGTDVVVPGPTKENYSNPGDSKTSDEIKLAAGSYEFYCSFPGHETTMKGTVVVK